MPHAVIEYSANIIPKNIIPLVHEAMIASGLFEADNIKTRAYVANDFMVGTKGAEGRFVHLTVAILSGRTMEQRQTLSQSLIDILKASFPDADSLTVEIREMDRETYRKQ